MIKSIKSAERDEDIRSEDDGEIRGDTGEQEEVDILKTSQTDRSEMRRRRRSSTQQEEKEEVDILKASQPCQSGLRGGEEERSTEEEHRGEAEMRIRRGGAEDHQRCLQSRA